MKKFKESLAEDNFQQIYDDLTDAEGYLKDDDNPKYKQLGKSVEFMKKIFNDIYEKSNSEEHEEWDELEDARNSAYKALHESSFKKKFIGTCQEIGMGEGGRLDEIYEDATEMSNDLGYYAVFDDSENPADSNYVEISKEEFCSKVAWLTPLNGEIKQIIKTVPCVFLKRKDDFMFVLYSEEDDIHYFFC